MRIHLASVLVDFYTEMLGFRDEARRSAGGGPVRATTRPRRALHSAARRHGALTAAVFDDTCGNLTQIQQSLSAG
jgi:uncharacterized glyoxalase superfamily protein PhnB